MKFTSICLGGRSKYALLRFRVEKIMFHPKMWKVAIRVKFHCIFISKNPSRNFSRKRWIFYEILLKIFFAKIFSWKRWFSLGKINVFKKLFLRKIFLLKFMKIFTFRAKNSWKGFYWWKCNEIPPKSQLFTFLSAGLTFSTRNRKSAKTLRPPRQIEVYSMEFHGIPHFCCKSAHFAISAQKSMLLAAAA